MPAREEAGTGCSTSSCSAVTSTQLPTGPTRRWPAPRRTTDRCCGSAVPTRHTCVPTTRRPWTAGSRATAGSWSRAPATGCTASSRGSSWRCSGASWLPDPRLTPGWHAVLGLAVLGLVDRDGDLRLRLREVVRAGVGHRDRVAPRPQVRQVDEGGAVLERLAALELVDLDGHVADGL